MKKLLLLFVGATMLVACNGNQTKEDALKKQNDSLLAVLSTKGTELDDVMSSFSEIQDGFNKINEAEGRVDLNKKTAENASNAEKIKEDMRFIQETMATNRQKIEELTQRLNKSNHASAQLKKMLANLQSQLDEKTAQLESLQKELEAKNVRIAELDDAVAGLNTDVNNLQSENESKSKTVAAQDKALNMAWFVYGTKSELKDQKILQKGEVLKTGDFNKDYFTEIDIRTDKEIKLYSKGAKLLTSHPAGSYTLVKDAKGQYILKITDPNQFWSVSRYLVIQVK